MQLEHYKSCKLNGYFKCFINYKVIASVAIEKKVVFIWGGTKAQQDTCIRGIQFPIEKSARSWGVDPSGSYYERNIGKKILEFLWNSRFYLTLLTNIILIARIYVRLEEPETNTHSIPVERNGTIQDLPIDPQEYAYAQLGPGEGSYGQLAASFYYFLTLIGINLVVASSKDSNYYIRLADKIEPAIPSEVNSDTLLGRLDHQTKTRRSNIGLFFIFNQLKRPLILDVHTLLPDARELIDNWVVDGHVMVDGKKIVFPNLRVIIQSKATDIIRATHRLPRFQLVNLSPKPARDLQFNVLERSLLAKLELLNNTPFTKYDNMPRRNAHLDVLETLLATWRLSRIVDIDSESQGLNRCDMYHKIRALPEIPDLFSGIVGRADLLNTLERLSQAMGTMLLLVDFRDRTTGIGKSWLISIFSQLLNKCEKTTLIVSSNQYGPRLSYSKQVNIAKIYKGVISSSLVIPTAFILNKLIRGYSMAMSFYDFINEISNTFTLLDSRLPEDTKNVEKTLTQMLTTVSALSAFLLVSLYFIVLQIKKENRYTLSSKKCIASNSGLLPQVSENGSIKPGLITRASTLTIENLDELPESEQGPFVDAVNTGSVVLGTTKTRVSTTILATSNTDQEWFEALKAYKIKMLAYGQYEPGISELEFLQYCHRLFKTTVPWDDEAINFFYSVCIQSNNNIVVINRAWETDLVPRANKYAVSDSGIIRKHHLERAFNDLFSLELPDGTYPNLWLEELATGKSKRGASFV